MAGLRAADHILPLAVPPAGPCPSCLQLHRSSNPVQTGKALCEHAALHTVVAIRPVAGHRARTE